MRIFVTHKFEGVHHYDAAPDEVAFLRDAHRHLFHVRAEIEVFHDDREIEFLLCKRNLIIACKTTLDAEGIDLGAKSCEQIAQRIADYLLHVYGKRQLRIEVSEDGENGAIIER